MRTFKIVSLSIMMIIVMAGCSAGVGPKGAGVEVGPNAHSYHKS